LKKTISKRSADLKNCVTHLNKTKNDALTSKAGITYVNMLGVDDDTMDDTSCVAKRSASIVNNNIVTHYFVKASSGGMFYNPQDKSFRGQLDSKRAAVGVNKFKLKFVSKSAYDAYIKFLQTGQTSFLMQAQRS